MQTEPKNISISVYEGNKERIQTSDNSSQEYIILQNEELIRQNKDYIVQINQNDIQIEELEIDNGKMETSIKNMRGILHNFSAKIKKQNKIIRWQKDKFKDLKDFTKVINKYVKSVIEYPKIYALISFGILITSYILGFTDLWQTFIYLLFDVIKLAIIHFLYYHNNELPYHIDDNIESMNKNIINYNNSIKSLEAEIVEIDKSNNFIEEYIDNI